MGLIGLASILQYFADRRDAQPWPSSDTWKLEQMIGSVAIDNFILMCKDMIPIDQQLLTYIAWFEIRRIFLIALVVWWRYLSATSGKMDLWWEEPKLFHSSNSPKHWWMEQLQANPVVSAWESQGSSPLRLVDADGDGQISASEFKAGWAPVLLLYIMI